MKRARLKEYKNGTWTTETRECDVRKESEQIEKKQKKTIMNSPKDTSAPEKTGVIITCLYVLVLGLSAGLNVYQYMLMRSFLDMIK
jgi:hypothetical protein|tara:strand:- start:5828 stop:6085 length:258 start_codon:yes stop_codon:yes gene_type:complete